MRGRSVTRGGGEEDEGEEGEERGGDAGDGTRQPGLADLVEGRHAPPPQR
jgi:hypothetical protein